MKIYNNIKTIFIFMLLLVLVVSLTGCNKNKEEQVNNVIIQSDDEKYQISLPEDIEIQFNTDENYTLDLFSEKDNFYLYVNTIYKTREIDLLDYVKDDKDFVLSNKNNTRDTIDIASINLKNYIAYSYSFTYTDSDFSKDFFTQIVWIETLDNIYILNLEVSIENKDKYIQIFNDIINSFTEL